MPMSKNASSSFRTRKSIVSSPTSPTSRKRTPPRSPGLTQAPAYHRYPTGTPRSSPAPPKTLGPYPKFGPHTHSRNRKPHTYAGSPLEGPSVSHLSLPTFRAKKPTPPRPPEIGDLHQGTRGVGSSQGWDHDSGNTFRNGQPPRAFALRLAENPSLSRCGFVY